MDMTTSHLPVKKTEDAWKRGATLEEAIDRVQKRSLRPHRVPLEKCRMDDDGRFFKPPVNEIYLRDQIKQISFDHSHAEDVVATLQWMSRQPIGANRLPLFTAFKKTAGKSLPLPKEPPFQEEDTYYDVYNHVTQAIQNPAMLYRRRLDVEAWAGSMVYTFHASLKAHATQAIWSGIKILMN